MLVSVWCYAVYLAGYSSVAECMLNTLILNIHCTLVCTVSLASILYQHTGWLKMKYPTDNIQYLHNEWSNFKNSWSCLIRPDIQTTGCGDIAYSPVGYFILSHPVHGSYELLKTVRFFGAPCMFNSLCFSCNVWSVEKSLKLCDNHGLHVRMCVHYKHQLTK